MLSGFKSFGTWVKDHPVTAAIIFVLIVPVALYFVITKIRNMVLALPVVGPALSKVSTLGAGSTSSTPAA